MHDERPLRMTESRRAILSAVEASESHPTADEVYELVRRRLPRVSLGTVYRNLDILARQGLITVLTDVGAQRRYDGRERRHHHVRCEICGRVDDVDLDDPDRVRRLLIDDRGYDINGYTLCFTGTCRACAERERPVSAGG